LEGYVLHTYGSERYLRHAVASVHTLRRHDSKRPVALYADESQIAILKKTGLDSLFQVLEVLPVENRSIVGFKHHLSSFKPFEKCLFVDSDIVWCRNPDPMWSKLQAYPFTVTGLEKADAWFGGPKGAGIVIDRLLDRRRRTMKRFGLTYLPRVQAGVIYAQDDQTTKEVTSKARELLSRRAETHFRSRLDEGRSEESCEWSIAMAMSALDLPIIHWFQGQDSPQMDYIDGYVDHDVDFNDVRCLYYTDAFIHGLRGLPNVGIRKALVELLSKLPGRGDYMWVTPYALHFGWMHHKQPFYVFADRIWESLLAGKNESGGQDRSEDHSVSLDLLEAIPEQI
jgi:hypothetical protein